MGKENALVQLAKRNKNIIKYLKEYEKELTILSFSDENVYNTLANLLTDISLVNLYLDNAHRLEELKVSKIKFVKELKSFDARGDRYICGFIPNRSKEGIQDRIKYILKYYTDGKVFPRLTEEQAHNYSRMCSTYNEVCFSIVSEATFVLRTENEENGYQNRSIEIMDFGFNGSKLPTIEEVQSYEIPKALIKSNRDES